MLAGTPCSRLLVLLTTIFLYDVAIGSYYRTSANDHSTVHTSKELISTRASMGQNVGEEISIFAPQHDIMSSYFLVSNKYKRTTMGL